MRHIEHYSNNLTDDLYYHNFLEKNIAPEPILLLNNKTEMFQKEEYPMDEFIDYKSDINNNVCFWTFKREQIFTSLKRKSTR